MYRKLHRKVTKLRSKLYFIQGQPNRALNNPLQELRFQAGLNLYYFVTSTYLFRVKFEAFNSHSTTGFLEVLSALELSPPFLIRLLLLFCSAACGVKLLFLRSPGISNVNKCSQLAKFSYLKKCSSKMPTSAAILEVVSPHSQPSGGQLSDVM